MGGGDNNLRGGNLHNRRLWIDVRSASKDSGIGPITGFITGEEFTNPMVQVQRSWIGSARLAKYIGEGGNIQKVTDGGTGDNSDWVPTE
jgi:hypothetical protein